MTGVLLQTTDGTLDYSGSWSDFLQTGETITASAWSVFPTAPIAGQVFDTATTRVMLSGLAWGKVYTLSNTITTSSTPARTETRSFTVRGAQL